jgi:hypothetical protein
LADDTRGGSPRGGGGRFFNRCNRLAGRLDDGSLARFLHCSRSLTLLVLITGGNVMKTTVASSWILACALVVSVAAQPPQPPTGQQPPQAKPAEERTVTLTGCLATGDQPGTFSLTHLRAADKPAAKPDEMVGTTGLKTGETVHLIGLDAAKLKDHVGHTISVTGMLVPRAEGDPAAKPGAPAMTGKAQMRLNVKSFKHIDATCQAIGK